MSLTFSINLEEEGDIFCLVKASKSESFPTNIQSVIVIKVTVPRYIIW